MAQWKQTQLVSIKLQVRSLAPLSELRIQRCCELMLLGSGIAVAVVWCRLAAVASIQSLAWELPYAASEALKKYIYIYIYIYIYKIVKFIEAEIGMLVASSLREGEMGSKGMNFQTIFLLL